MKPQLIILINPLQLHDSLCKSLIKAEIKIIALYTHSPGENNYLQINPNYFIAHEVLTKNFSEDIATIKKMTRDYHLISILPAVEVDLEYAEKIAYALHPTMTNHPNSSHLRYKKYDMNDAVKKAGLNHIPQIRLDMGQTIQNIENLDFPVVVKPSFQSGASVGVKICHHMHEVQSHLAILQQSDDPHGKKLESDIIIQEKIEGEEYFADTVTWKGKHYITAIFKCKKIEMNGLPIYRYLDFISPQNEIWDLCYDFIQKTLDALQVNHGFAHTEFMLTPNNKIYLIEINPRMSGIGGEINRLCDLLTDYDQAQIYVNLLTNNFKPEKLYEKYKTQNKHGRLLLLFAWKNMAFRGLKSAPLNKLRSAQYTFKEFKAKGTSVMAPENLLDIVACVSIVDENIESIREDTNLLQQLEKAGSLFNE